MFTDKDYSLYNGIPKTFRHLRNKKLSDWEIAPWDLLIDRDNLIGAGEFGQVYLSTWKSSQVVAKVMNDNICLEMKKLFLNEFDNLSKCHHPNIDQLFGYVDNPFIIVMEYLPENNLLHFIYKNKLSINKKIDICLDILKGVEYLHSRKPQSIIHRDLKPQNIILSECKRAKIADFGLSKLLKESSIKSSIDSESSTLGSKLSNEDLTKIVGTKRYMSPEVSKQMEYNHKIDIWSLGILFSELFENRRYNSEFYWYKTPIKIQNIINQFMLRQESRDRLNANEIINLLEQVRRKNVKWCSCWSFFNFQKRSS